MTDTESNRAVVEQAKGAIMLRYGVSSYESLAAMARWAREAHVPLEEVAHALVKGICQGRVTAETQGMVRWLEQRLRTDISEPPKAVAEMVLRRSTVAGQTPTQPPRSPATAAATRPQWRYTSAVPAARALSGS
jgi:hypothetical protein